MDEVEEGERMKANRLILFAAVVFWFLALVMMSAWVIADPRRFSLFIAAWILVDAGMLWYSANRLLNSYRDKGSD